MSKVFVLDTNKHQLEPIHQAQARQLLKNGKAAIFRRFPFTLILKESRLEAPVQPLRLKIDPGARNTGFALVNDATGEVVWAAELQHRGFQIRNALTARRQLRKSRRNRKTRYRQARFLNRTRPEGWLPPSLESRVCNIETWVQRLRKFAPISAFSVELVRFNTQLMQNPEISGVQYQQGELQGYEVREYLLEKWNRQCAYCGVKNVPLEVEHIHPRFQGGSNRVSNLTLSCHTCNQLKGSQDVWDFLEGKPDLLKRIMATAKQPLVDAAAVNSTRWALYRHLKQTGLPVETGTGGRTKFNRTSQQLPKTHWIDAACVGASTPQLQLEGVKPLQIVAKGHGTRQMCGTDKFGFPIRHRSRVQIHKGFQTGDIVKAIVTKGKKIGTYIGRTLCRSKGSFDITTATGRVTGISHKFCQPIHEKDGYSYVF